MSRECDGWDIPGRVRAHENGRRKKCGVEWVFFSYDNLLNLRAERNASVRTGRWSLWRNENEVRGGVGFLFGLCSVV